MARAIHGGVWFLQVTWNAETEQWHPHLHCVLDADYVDQRILSRKWLQVTHTSKIVDIRKVNRRSEVSRYVCRYVSRPCELAPLPLPRREELFWAFQGRRLAGTWGSARKLRLTYNPPDPVGTWRTVGSWALVWGLASTDVRAATILSAWLNRTPLAADVTLYDVFNDADGLPAEVQPEPPPSPIQEVLFG